VLWHFPLCSALPRNTHLVNGKRPSFQEAISKVTSPVCSFLNHHSNKHWLPIGRTCKISASWDGLSPCINPLSMSLNQHLTTLVYVSSKGIGLCVSHCPCPAQILQVILLVYFRSFLLPEPPTQLGLLCNTWEDHYACSTSTPGVPGEYTALGTVLRQELMRPVCKCPGLLLAGWDSSEVHVQHGFLELQAERLQLSTAGTDLTTYSLLALSSVFHFLAIVLFISQ
jgi:hypothetical protein